MLDLNLKDKINKIMNRKVCSKRSLAYANFLISKYELKNKNYSKELDFLKKGQQLFFESKKVKFNSGIKYFFDDVFQPFFFQFSIHDSIPSFTYLLSVKSFLFEGFLQNVKASIVAVNYI